MCVVVVGLMVVFFKQLLFYSFDPIGAEVKGLNTNFLNYLFLVVLSVAKKLEKYGFEIFIGNQSDKNFWKEFYRKIGKIDILFDDGGHKNIQQISTVENSLEHINDNGIIVVEDTHTSFLKEFKNPSYFSFINYCNKLIKNIHKRCEWVSKKNNIYSNKIWSIDFYESIVAINIDSKRCMKS